MRMPPYWWFFGRKDSAKEPPFSAYIMRRHALLQPNQPPEIFVYPYPDSPKGEKTLEWIYQLLGVLDTKASALMRLNGVMLAAASFLLHADSSTAIKFLVAGSGIASAISIACCLLVVGVDWPFLGLVVDKGEGEARKLDFSQEFFHLQKVADFRQGCFRVGWTISFLATVTFLVAIILFFGHLCAFSA